MPQIAAWVGCDAAAAPPGGCELLSAVSSAVITAVSEVRVSGLH